MDGGAIGMSPREYHVCGDDTFVEMARYVG